MTGWLIDTLIWTAALIALVLVLRRPVTVWLGPQFAYALWLLPAVRLVMPPLQLPAWLNPAPVQDTAQTVYILTQSGGPTAIQAPESAASSSWMSLLPQLPYLEIGLGVWLIGAAVFLYRRFESYFRLRSELLADGREVGRDGRIRLIETPGTDAPLALGVIDPIVVLPIDFMAMQDRTARDLAIAHELAHHKGQDLLVNMAVQPLFALHWFNPLARFGWMALRRDQEAACDARVIASKPNEDRAAYAGLIATFATSPDVTLAAPMACPVLGEKSIIHRLRSLKMNDVSPRRRMAGRLAIGAAVLALPLTASITYAESAADEVTLAPLAPAAPAAPMAPGAPNAPLPPAPPAAPTAPLAMTMQAIEEVDPDTGPDTGDASEGRKERVLIVKVEDEDGNLKEEKLRYYPIRRDDSRASGDGETNVGVEKTLRAELKNGGEMSDAEIEEIIKEVREGMAEADKVIANIDVVVADAMAEAGEHRTMIKMECKSGQDEVSWTSKDDDGQGVVHLCKANIMADALSGLKEARAEIASDKDMADKLRTQILNELDEQIARWSKKSK